MAKKVNNNELFFTTANVGTLAFQPATISLTRKNPSIKKVIFNNPATIIIWDDGTKTVVKCQDEPFDPERGMAMAIAKKFFGNKGRYNNEFKKWVGEYRELQEQK